MHDLHTGTNLYTVYYWPCERGFKNLRPGGENLFVQICTLVQFMQMNAKCFTSIRFDRKF